MSRRAFVRSLSGALALAAFDIRETARLTLRILADSTTGSFRDGVSMGLSEAQRTASLFNREPIAVVKGTAGIVIGMSEYDPDGDSVYFNCGSRSDSYRARCNPFVFHVAAGDAIYANAARIAKVPRVELWSSKLEKYGAAQLNDRYRSGFHREMDADAWCGWFAVKVVWESAMRMHGEGAAALREYLTRESTQFDGHKGAPLSFRARDHELRQPLYALGDGRPPEDVPDVARSTSSMRESLESIMPTARCRQ